MYLLSADLLVLFVVCGGVTDLCSCHEQFQAKNLNSAFHQVRHSGDFSAPERVVTRDNLMQDFQRPTRHMLTSHCYLNKVIYALASIIWDAKIDTSKGYFQQPSKGMVGGEGASSSTLLRFSKSQRVAPGYHKTRFYLASTARSTTGSLHTKMFLFKKGTTRGVYTKSFQQAPGNKLLSNQGACEVCSVSSHLGICFSCQMNCFTHQRKIILKHTATYCYKKLPESSR